MTQAVRSAVRLPAGVRDFLPRAAARRRAISDQVMAELWAWGYERIITPMFEHAEVLERGLGADARAAALRFVDPDSGDLLALRPDITPQIARIAATRLGDIEGPLRLCYEGAAWRAEPGARRQREILQAGAEIIGAGSPDGDAEAMAVAAAVLAKSRIPELRLDIGHVALARFALAQIADPQQRAEIRRLLAKKDRHGTRAASAGLPDAAQKVLCALPALYGEPDEVLATARALPIHADVAASFDLLAAVIARAKAAVADPARVAISVDLGEVRGFEYYTGVRFSGYIAGAGDAILRGGRYDDLLGRYGRPGLATGFALDLEAIALAQHACGIDPPAARRGLLITAADQGAAIALAGKVREAGFRAATDLGAPREAEALRRYAAEVGLTHVAAIHEDGTATVYPAAGADPDAALVATVERLMESMSCP